MNKLNLTMAVATLLFSLGFAPCGAAEMREWTSARGSTIQAELVSKTDTHLTLRKASGKEITLAIKQLSDADQDYLSELDEGAESQEVTTEKTDTVAKKARRPLGKNMLPVLAVGEGEGYFVHYSGDHYDARINRDGTMDVYLKKDGGEGLIDGWKMVIQPIAYKKNRLGTFTRYLIEEVTKHGDPAANPETVELSVKLKGDIKCDLIYEFTEDGMTTWMRSEDGYDPREVMAHFLSHHCGSVLGLTKDPEDLKKMRLKMESQKYDFWGKYPTNNSQSQDDFEISMPAISSTKIIFDKGSDKKVRLLPWKYGTDALSKGFTIRTRKAEYESANHRSEKTTITFKGK